MGAPSVSLRLILTGHAVAHGLARALDPVGLDLRHYRVLCSVGERSGCPQRQVSDNLHIPPSRVVAIVDSLESRGLLQRVTSPADRRAHSLILTGTGAAVLAEAGPLVAEHEATLLAGLDSDERAALDRLLDRLDVTC